MARLLLATRNRGKQEEMRDLLKDLRLTLVVPEGIEIELNVEERETNYAGNASLKALAYASATGMWALADDSGLEVDALHGAPGLHSARLAGPHRDDGDRRRLLLSMLQPHPRPWTARFRATVALASPQGEVELAEGVCRGEVTPDARGTGGFGYDPIFLVEGTDRTMAELTLDEKNRISHRARAVKAILPLLRLRIGLEDDPPPEAGDS